VIFSSRVARSAIYRALDCGKLSQSSRGRRPPIRPRTWKRRPEDRPSRGQSPRATQPIRRAEPDHPSRNARRRRGAESSRRL